MRLILYTLIHRHWDNVENSLKQHKMKTVPTYDTAGSVKIIKELSKKDIVHVLQAKHASADL